MKLEMARGLFLVAALATTTMAVAAWEQPSTRILSTPHGEGYCPLPRAAKPLQTAQPDHDFLLLLYSLLQGTGTKS
ncbi:hypothetical protein NJC40_02065 [Pseudomonas sp. 21LCFQ02]|uniref:hypothetical protein n=1 Tax=unclassified Pseudomonas TaxID=196821 RepID=UPI0005ED4621|nr:MULTISPECIES: hypothetical protein [unclassified Pseudomonas]MCO8162132.1 hypothetical protein [Pseudomonas sp. 21LCFQ010]MCO8166562.1 hypothetical protein [Pseudomonas sp. 21LCFQ02]MCQ9422422.1 hypothetical protein [Pseudomonas sp. LJDD11]